MSVIGLFLSMLFLMGTKTDKIPISSIEQDIDKKEATIGDRLHFKVDVYSEENEQVVLPENYPTLGSFVVKNRNVKTLTKNPKISLTLKGCRASSSTPIRKRYKRTTLEYELVSYDVGKNTLPSLSIVVKREGSSEEFKTIPLTVEIKSVSPGLTGKEDIKGIKPQRAIKIPYWYYVLGFLSIAVIAGTILLMLRKRRKVLIEERIERIAPWEKAFSELDKLVGTRTTTEEEIKFFYTRLSFIMRDYLESLYLFPALENTTSELMNNLKTRKELKPYLVETGNFLNQSDLVKFAKYIPTRVDSKEEISVIRSLIDNTKKDEEESHD